MDSIHNLKRKTESAKNKAEVLYYYGKRWPAIHHTHLGIGCSKVNCDGCFHLDIPNVNPEYDEEGY